MTIKEIAREAGVAMSTVSLVLNNKPGVRKETRARAAAFLVANGYTIREAAPAETGRGEIRFLRFIASNHISERNHEFFIDLLNGAERRAREQGFDFSYANVPPGEFAAAIRALETRDNLADVLVLASELNAEGLPPLLHYLGPVVLLDTPLDYCPSTASTPIMWQACGRQVVALKILLHNIKQFECHAAHRRAAKRQLPQVGERVLRLGLIVKMLVYDDRYIPSRNWIIRIKISIVDLNDAIIAPLADHACRPVAARVAGSMVIIMTHARSHENTLFSFISALFFQCYKHGHRAPGRLAPLPDRFPRLWPYYNELWRRRKCRNGRIIFSYVCRKNL